jgi:signal peptidase I
MMLRASLSIVLCDSWLTSILRRGNAIFIKKCAPRAQRIVFLSLLLVPVASTWPLYANVLSRTVTALAALQTDMPVVFVDPVNVTANVGDTVTISVHVFNLSGRFWPTDVTGWTDGDPLPPYVPGGPFNMSLGHLYAIDLQLQWDPTILEYVNHTVKVPVEDHVGGLLHEPVIEVLDTADPVAGTYRLARSSRAPASAFNAPDANATAVTITFHVAKAGKCTIDFTNVDLAVDLLGLGFPHDMWQEIPHWVVNSQFQTGDLATRIERIQGGALVAGSLYDPIIQGEDMVVRVQMKNDNETTTDTFNLSLYDGPALLTVWENEDLTPDSTKTLNYTLSQPNAGLHSIKAEASVLHAGEVVADQLEKNIAVVLTPDLAISGPSSALTGTAVSFSAADSVHNDPNGNITTYTWTLWKPGETVPVVTVHGPSADVSFPLQFVTTKTGNWTVMLVVEDNFGITAHPLTGGWLTPAAELLRPATASYRQLWTLNVQNKPQPVDYDLQWQMLSGSMLPAVEVLDMIYVKNVSGQTEIHASYLDGDIILFRKPGDPDELILHRAVEKVTGGLRTKGDNNPSADSWVVTDSDLVGKAVALSRAKPAGAHNVTVFSTSTFTDVSLNVTGNALEILVGTPLTQSATSSLLNITIPNALVTGDLDVLINGVPRLFEYSANSTHHCVWLNWDDANYSVVIVLPEIATLSVLPLFMVATLLASRACRRRRARS